MSLLLSLVAVFFALALVFMAFAFGLFRGAIL